MWTRLSAWISRVSNGWVAGSALAIFVLFTILVLPNQASRADVDAGGAGSPDTSFYYTGADLYRMAEAYGAAGRKAYVQARFTFDLVWPLVYTLFLCTGISWANRRAYGTESPWQLANLVPLAGALFDYLENLSTSLVMIRYPAETGVVAALAGPFTLLKWLFVGGSMLLLLIGVVVGVWRWAQREPQPGA
ncbi:MAG: hypothetical protein P8X95_26890 [Anaerolineales bacterium]|jgi:hypothetical protein